MSCVVCQGVVFCQAGYLGAAAVVALFVQSLVMAYLIGRYS